MRTFNSLSDVQNAFSTKGLTIPSPQKKFVSGATEGYLLRATEAFNNMTPGPVLDGVISAQITAYHAEIGGVCVAWKGGNY